MKTTPYKIVRQTAFWLMMILVIWTSFVYAPYMKERECCPCLDWLPVLEPNNFTLSTNSTQNEQGANETNYSFYIPDLP